MPPFQGEVRFDEASGVVGEYASDSPFRASPQVLNSADPANNVVGRAMFHEAASDKNVAAEGADTLVFAGILANPKVYASRGDSSGSLAPTLTLDNGEIVECVRMGILFVELTTAAEIGQAVYADNATGELASGASAPAGFTEIPNSKVVGNNISGAGLAIIQLTD